MTLTANEQYFLELVNRGRLDPAAEARRYGIDLNASLTAGTISTASKQVLASNAFLDLAAEAHSSWMLQTDIFSHTGIGNSNPGQRMTNAGYVFAGSWTWGENIAWSGTTGSVNATAAIEGHHRGLFLSSGHRTNIMGETFREIGIAQVIGQFTANGTVWNASMATEKFAKSGSAVFLTGVVYNDGNNNDFYSVGEGVAGTTFAIGGTTATTQAAGGYSLATVAAAGVSVTVKQGAATSVVQVDLSLGNAKLDLVDGSLFLASQSLRLVSGVADATLLGVAGLTLWGNTTANDLTGNAGANKVYGGGGNDSLNGGHGSDRLMGGAGTDVQLGGAGADFFVMMNGDGQERVVDFTLAQGDRLVFDDALWGNVARTAAQVVAGFAKVTASGVAFDFGGGDVMSLTGLVTTAGLAAQIDFV